MNYRKILIAFFLSFSIFSVNGQKPITAVIGAFSNEVKLLEDSLKNKKTVVIKGIRFMTGKLRDKKVVIALTGVGKVNAAMTTTLILSQWKPQRVIFTGIAGGLNPSLQPGDLVIATSTIQHDYGVELSSGFEGQPTHNPIDYSLNPHYFKADSILLSIAKAVHSGVSFQSVGKNERKPNVISGIIATGDVFVNSQERSNELIKNFRADAIEMEGAAVAQVCYHFQTPCLVIRSISDNANADAHKDIRNFEGVAAYNSANLVLRILQEIK